MIGDNAVDVPWYFRGPDGGPRPAAAISASPYMQPVTAPMLLDFAHRQRGRFANIYLILRRGCTGGGRWPYGPFVNGLLRGQDIPGLRSVAMLDDALVFRLEPERGGSP